MKFYDLYEAIAWEAKLLEHIFMGNIPLRNSILKRLDALKKIDTAYHICSFENIDNLKKMVGKNKALSTFTRGHYDISYGIQGGDDVLVEVEGEQLMSFETDSDTSPENGTRWVSGDFIFEDNFKKEYKKMVEKLFNTKIGKFKYEYDVEKRVPNRVKNYDGKKKSKLIKQYFNEVEKLYKKYTLEKVFKENKYKADSYNEVLVQQIKIKEIYLIAGDNWDYNDFDFDNITSEVFDINASEQIFKKYKNELTGVIYRDDIEQVDIEHFIHIDVKYEF